eukprot:GHVT01021016.1.p3 GENE.GHVT01021016.1~~GHVT01021016.1.p3  ORF type:complete len:109 (-),score=12.78 GHVT01021016.1:351-677(-)
MVHPTGDHLLAKAHITDVVALMAAKDNIMGVAATASIMVEGTNMAATASIMVEGTNMAAKANIMVVRGNMAAKARTEDNTGGHMDHLIVILTKAAEVPGVTPPNMVAP